MFTVRYVVISNQLIGSAVLHCAIGELGRDEPLMNQWPVPAAPADYVGLLSISLFVSISQCN
jgi:hypothetical protein